MADTNAIIEFLEQQTNLSETAQVMNFRGYRKTGEGDIQAVTIEVLDRGERAGAYRYAVSFRSDDDLGGGGDYAETVEDAIAIATVHWGSLG
jgi:hypothetical protein